MKKMTISPSENILKLRELTDEICSREENKYKEVILNLKRLVDESREEINNCKTIKHKIRCYENMCVDITKVLNNIKIK